MEDNKGVFMGGAGGLEWEEEGCVWGLGVVVDTESGALCRGGISRIPGHSCLFKM